MSVAATGHGRHRRHDTEDDLRHKDNRLDYRPLAHVDLLNTQTGPLGGHPLEGGTHQLEHADSKESRDHQSVDYCSVQNPPSAIGVYPSFLQTIPLRALCDTDQHTIRQLTGLAALISLAVPEATVVPFSDATTQYGARKYLPSLIVDQAKTDGVKSGLSRYLRADGMVRNSLYLLLTSGVQAALGFTFWIVAARFFSSADVGRAGSLISAATLIGFFGLLGLNSTFIRYLPNSLDRDALISAGLILVAACSAGMALIYVILTPLLAPRIAFIAHSLPLALGFILFTSAGAINVLTDSVFIAAGKSGFNVFVDGIVAGVTKVALVVALAGAGAYGIFCATSGSFVAAALSSLMLMAIVLRWRPNLRGVVKALKPVLRFSGANYIGNVLNLLPILVVPLIILDRIGASAAGYFYVSFQLASLLFSTVYSVEQAFLAECASIGKIGRALMRRSFVVLVALCVPALILVVLFGHQLLLAFGVQYGNHGESCLIRLTAAVVPIAASNWFLTILRLSNRLKAVVISNTVYACIVCGLAWMLAPQGLSAVAIAWPVGATGGALVAAVAAIGAVPRKQAPRHRR